VKFEHSLVFACLFGNVYGKTRKLGFLHNTNKQHTRYYNAEPKHAHHQRDGHHGYLHHATPGGALDTGLKANDPKIDWTADW